MSRPYRLAVDVDLELYERLKLAAAERGISIPDFCVGATEEVISPDQAIGPDPILQELWDNEDDAVYDQL